MKKLFTVFVIMILVASFALAQKKVRKVIYETVDDESGTMIAGAKFGLNFATFGGDNSSNYSTTTKFFFGGFFGYDFIRNFGLQGELLYNPVGGGYSSPGQAGGNNGISYLDFVVLAKYSVPVSPVIKIFFEAGPQLGIKLSATDHSDATGTDTDISQYISGTDFDLVVGTGTAFRVGPGNIIFDVRYNIGLSTIQKNGNAHNSNQVFSMAVGYGLFIN
jgi:opacity protein-like surface antigen